ncbi:MAG: UDP-N-acetylmuramoyl-L-alanyl-D-glutamate--2,6-diaminopimelate ligase [Bacteroidales bacterium]|nr:UDP-N-acetylmuramoyl-L-alanyl-D-glutamate--2,6-diaminopimelate ligase [Bacteroidales bacterium]
MENNLKKLLNFVEHEAVHGEPMSISSVVFDSRKIEKESLFVAVKGTQSDGHQYIDACIEHGATAVVCEVLPNQLNPKVCYIKVKDSQKALGQMAHAYYENPSRNLKLVGVTGTNGKTTIATLLFELMEALGFKTGLLSTVENKIHKKVVKSTHTTPDPVQINALMQEMVEAGCEYCFMEVSSHSIVQERIAGLEFDGAVFTNITHDHLDYHGTFKEYIKAKKQFFDQLSPKAFALTNIDDKNGMVMLQNTKAIIKTYGVKQMADYKSKAVEKHFDGTLIQCNKHEFWTSLIGDFNIYNITAIVATAVELGFEWTEVLAVVSQLKSVNGRFETLRSAQGITAIVDYAHTPDALENVLQTITNLRIEGQQIITVVGAGGDRDKTKRPEMAKIGARFSNRLILTSDNPRSEDPDAILNDMEQGLDPVDRQKTLRISDRATAIKTAAMLAQPDDIILIAGKGHETYQEIKGVRTHFDDKEVIQEALIAQKN